MKIDAILDTMLLIWLIENIDFSRKPYQAFRRIIYIIHTTHIFVLKIRFLVSKAKDVPKKSSNLKRERLRRGASGADKDGSSSDGDAYLYEPPQPKSKLTQAGTT